MFIKLLVNPIFPNLIDLVKPPYVLIYRYLILMSIFYTIINNLE